MYRDDQHEYLTIIRDKGSTNIQCVFRIGQVQCILWMERLWYKVLNKEKAIDKSGNKLQRNQQH